LDTIAGAAEWRQSSPHQRGTLPVSGRRSHAAAHSLKAVRARRQVSDPPLARVALVAGCAALGIWLSIPRDASALLAARSETALGACRRTRCGRTRPAHASARATRDARDWIPTSRDQAASVWVDKTSVVSLD
jgi:hypothetical protein